MILHTGSIHRLRMSIKKLQYDADDDLNTHMYIVTLLLVSLYIIFILYFPSNR